MSEHETLRERLAEYFDGIIQETQTHIVSADVSFTVIRNMVTELRGLIQAELAASDAENAKLRELVQRMKPFYLRHTSDCSFDLMNSSPNSDYCDCGLAKRRSLLAESAQ